MLQSDGLAFVLGWAPLPSLVASQFSDVKGTGWGWGWESSGQELLNMSGHPQGHLHPQPPGGGEPSLSEKCSEDRAS